MNAKKSTDPHEPENKIMKGDENNESSKSRTAIHFTCKNGVRF